MISYLIQWVVLIAGLALIPLAWMWAVWFEEGELYIQWDEAWIGLVGAALALVSSIMIVRLTNIRKAIARADSMGGTELLGTRWILLPFVSGVPGIATAVLLLLARRDLEPSRSPLFAWPGFVPVSLRRPVFAFGAFGGVVLIGAVVALLATGPLSGVSLEWYEERAVGTWQSYHSPDGSYSWFVLKSDRTGCHISTWTGGDDNWDMYHWKLTEPTGTSTRYTVWYNEHTQVTWGTFDLDQNVMLRGGSTVYSPTTDRPCP